MLHSQKDTLTKIEKEIISYLNNQVELSPNIKNMGQSAVQVASHLKMERSNASRLLNQLNRKGLLAKQLGRPVLFFAKETIKDRFGLEYFPSIIESDQGLASLLHTRHDRSLSSAKVLEIDQKLNPKLYELLNKVINTFNYPSHSLDVLVYGAEGSGKSVFVRQVFDTCIRQRIISPDASLITIDCTEVGKEDIYTHVLKTPANRSHRNLIEIKNVDSLSSENQTKLYYLLTNKEKIYYNRTPDLFIITSQDKSTGIYSRLKYILPTEIILLNFEERTIRERLLFVIHFFQNEVDIINKPVLIKYNILNCFLMSRFPLNFLQLKKEIQSAILHNRSSSLVNPYLEITYDDLSDDLLNHMSSGDQLEQEIKTLYQALGIRNAMLNPGTMSSFQATLMNRHAGRGQLKRMEADDDDRDTLFFNCKEMIVKALNQSASVPQEENNILREFSVTIQKALPDFFLYQHGKLFENFRLLISDLIIANDEHEQNKQADPLQYTELNLQVIDFIEGYYNLKLAAYSRQAVHYYLYIASAVLRESNVSFVIFTQSEKAATLYLKLAAEASKTIPAAAHVLDDRVTKEGEMRQILRQYHQQLNEGKGLVFLFENDISPAVKEEIENLSSLYIEGFSANQLKLLISRADHRYHFVEDLKQYTASNEFLNDYTDYEEISRQIEENILNELLTFLNPRKIISSCEEVLADIMQALNLEPSEKLYIQFITHVSFMVERIKEKNILVYKHTSEYLAHNTELIQIVEKALNSLARTFGVKIPLSEVIYITDLIKENMDADKINPALRR